MRPQLEGRWSPLPTPHPGKRPHHVALALSDDALYAGLTFESAAPIVLRGRFMGGELGWTKPWAVPLPPYALPPPTDWAEFAGSLYGLEVSIDVLDPLRIAVTRIEYQGGSWGIVVHRWGAESEEIASPTDADIHFGEPLLLRGDELLTQEISSFWHFRRRGAAWKGEELLLDRHFSDPRRAELGCHVAIDDAGDRLVLSAIDALLVLERDASGRFAVRRRVELEGALRGLTHAGSKHLAIVERAGELDVLWFDAELRETDRVRLSLGHGLDASMSTVSTDGTRVLVCADARAHAGAARCFAFDVATRDLLEIAIPPEARDARGGIGWLAHTLRGDRLVVATAERVGVYDLASAR